MPSDSAEPFQGKQKQRIKAWTRHGSICERFSVFNISSINGRSIQPDGISVDLLWRWRWNFYSPNPWTEIKIQFCLHAGSLQVHSLPHIHVWGCLTRANNGLIAGWRKVVENTFCRFGSLFTIFLSAPTVSMLCFYPGARLRDICWSSWSRIERSSMKSFSVLPKPNRMTESPYKFSPWNYFGRKAFHISSHSLSESFFLRAEGFSNVKICWWVLAIQLLSPSSGREKSHSCYSIHSENIFFLFFPSVLVAHSVSLTALGIPSTPRGRK